MSVQDLQRLNDQGKRFVYRLGVLVRTARIHETGNRALDFSLRAAASASEELLRVSGPFELMGEGHLVHVNGMRLRLDRAMLQPVAQLLSILRERGVGGLSVSASVSPPALREAIGALLEAPPVPPGQDETLPGHAAAINARLKAEGLRWQPALRLRSGTVGAEEGGEGHSVQVEASRAVALYVRALKAVEILRLYGGRDGVPRGVARVAQQIVDLAHDEPRFFLSLTGLKQPGVGHHLRNTVHGMILAVALGRRLGMPRAVLLDLALAAMSARLSLLNLPDAVLLKPGPLDEAEWALVRRQPLESAQAALGAPSLDLSTRRRARVALDLELDVDGGGHPRLRWPRSPHLMARMLRICLTYDALTSEVPWRHAMLPDEALEAMMGEAGTRLDAALMGELVNLLGRYPLGTALLLDTGEVGVVYIPPTDLGARDRPVLKLLTDGDGVRLARPELADLQERTPEGRWRRSVHRVLSPSELGIDLPRVLFG